MAIDIDFEIPGIIFTPRTDGCVICGKTVKDKCHACQENFCDEHLKFLCIVAVLKIQAGVRHTFVRYCPKECRGGVPVCIPCCGEHGLFRQ